MRISRSKGQMYPMIELYEGSGLRQRDFCSEHGLSVSVFSYWLKKYRMDQTEKEGSTKFIEAELSGATIKTHNGITVRYLGAEFLLASHDEVGLRTVLKVMGDAR